MITNTTARFVAVLVILAAYVLALAPQQHVHYGSPAIIGQTEGYLEDGTKHSRVCDGRENGIKAIQRLYNTRGERINSTVDGNGTNPGCGNEWFEQPKAAHDVGDGATSNYSIHY